MVAPWRRRPAAVVALSRRRSRAAVALAATALIASVVVAASAPRALAAGVFYIRGGGDGHGVGMSQYGADGYALHGASYRFILAHYYEGTSLGTAAPDQIVKVLLGVGSPAVSGATQARGDGRAAKSAALVAGITYAVEANANGSLMLVAQSGSGKRFGPFNARLTVSGPGPLSVAGLGRYRGALELRPGGSGAIETVNAVDLEDYVRGVVAGEIPASWPAQALDAQAVAARTFALTSDVGGSAFDVYDDTRSQVYGGVGAQTSATDAAVAATSGQIVTYNGAPAATYFFASSGGYTENVENVWAGSTPEPWLRGVPDPYDSAGGNPYYRWRYKLSPGAAQAKLGALVKGALLGIKVTTHGVSPRIMIADVVGTGGTTVVNGGELQDAFGLMSTDARFTTITSAQGPPPQIGREVVGLPAGAVSTPALAALARELVTDAALGLDGLLFPARQGITVAIQADRRGGWRTVTNARVGAGGRYSVALPAPGSYRVVYSGLDGPVVTVR